MNHIPSGQPPATFREKLLIPVEVPAWGVIVAIVTGAFAFGILYNQLAVLVKNQEKVDLMYERQVKNIENVNRHERVIEVQGQEIKAQGQEIKAHEFRLQALERRAR
jgi:hypothetical protein